MSRLCRQNDHSQRLQQASGLAKLHRVASEPRHRHGCAETSCTAFDGPWLSRSASIACWSVVSEVLTQLLSSGAANSCWVGTFVSAFLTGGTDLYQAYASDLPNELYRIRHQRRGGSAQLRICPERPSFNIKPEPATSCRILHHGMVTGRAVSFFPSYVFRPSSVSRGLGLSLQRVVSDDRLNLVLVKLVEYLGHKSTIVPVAAFNEVNPSPWLCGAVAWLTVPDIYTCPVTPAHDKTSFRTVLEVSSIFRSQGLCVAA